MDLNLWLAFCVTAFLLALAPGPDIIFVVMYSAMHGARSGISVACGLCTGLIFHTCLAAFGIAALIAASPKILLAIKTAGALYLTYLAWCAWIAKVQEGSSGEVKTPALSGWALWRRGCIMNISNPKVLVFFLAFLSQFLTSGSGSFPVFAQMILLGLTFMAVTFVTFSAMACLAGSVADAVRTPKVQRVMNKVCAVIFVGIALGLVLTEV